MADTYRKVELKAAGDEFTMDVEHVFFNDKSATHKYPDFTFKGHGDGVACMIYVPENACRRQFSRAKMEPEDAKGRTVRFHRDANDSDPSKPYWGISVLENSTPRPTRPQERVQPTPAVAHSTTDQGAIDAAYTHALEAAFSAQLALKTKFPTGAPLPTADSVQAGAATILIAYQKAGPLPVPPASNNDGDPGPDEPDPDDPWNPADDDGAGSLPF